MAVFFQCSRCGRDHGIPTGIREQAFPVFLRRFAQYPEFHSLFCPGAGQRVQVGPESLIWRESRAGRA